jgi:hypothetical protein
MPTLLNWVNKNCEMDRTSDAHVKQNIYEMVIAKPQGKKLLSTFHKQNLKANWIKQYLILNFHDMTLCNLECGYQCFI